MKVHTVSAFVAAPTLSDQSIVPGAVCTVHSPVNGLNVCWAVINNLSMTNYQSIFEQVFQNLVMMSFLKRSLV